MIESYKGDFIENVQSDYNVYGQLTTNSYVLPPSGIIVLPPVMPSYAFLSPEGQHHLCSVIIQGLILGLKY